MELSLAKKIVANGEAGTLCVVNPIHNSEHNGEVCSIRRINNGWLEIGVNFTRINVRAKDIEVLRVAKELGWRD